MFQWLAWLLFSFQGRIPRKHFWLAQLIIITIPAAFYYAANGLNLPPESGPKTLVDVGWGLFFLYPQFAVTVKRFNDRGQPRWLSAVWLVVNSSNLVFLYWFDQRDVTDHSHAEWIVFVAYLIILVWFLIDLGILSGERGANRHGPDPLARPGAAAISATPPPRRTFGPVLRDGLVGVLTAIAVIALIAPESVDYAFRRLFVSRKVIDSVNMPAFSAYMSGGKAADAGDHEAAIRELTRAIELYGADSPAADSAYRMRATVFLDIDRPKQAFADLNMAIRVDPDAAGGYYDRGDFYAKYGSPNKALKDFASALRLNPDYTDVLIARGHLLRRLGRPQEAHADFEQAIVAAQKVYEEEVAKLDEEDSASREQRVKRKGRSRDYRIARAHTGRGQLYEKQGRLDLAHEEYRRAAALRKPNDWLRSALRRTQTQ